jgi:hypothetical protein
MQVPLFQNVAVFADDAVLAAEISSLFGTTRSYLAVCDGPRMGRPDNDNEALRRINFLAKLRPRRVLVAGLADSAAEALQARFPRGDFGVRVKSREEAVAALTGYVTAPAEQLAWGNSNLGIGLLLARRSGLSLMVGNAPDDSGLTFVEGSLDTIIVCERENEFAAVVASNLAFATGASFAVFAGVSKALREEWLESLYSIGSSDQTKTFEQVRDEVSAYVPEMLKGGKFAEVLFVTEEFPWGVALPEVPTTHLYGYPDFGRSVVNGIWATLNKDKSCRTALLIQPGQVDGAEIDVMAAALVKNGAVVKRLRDRHANVLEVDTAIQTMPYDFIGIATHAGECKGERLTYEFVDRNGQKRKLVIDEAVGIGLKPHNGLYQVTTFNKFRSIDAVNWSDGEGKIRIGVGDVLQDFYAMSFDERRKLITARVDIPRVHGAMALQMHDDNWLPMLQGLPESGAAIVLNNACCSLHEMSKHFIFAGARCYIGTLFPISDSEAFDVTKELFGHMGQTLPKALWNAHRKVYGGQVRRPYVVFGLPFCRMVANHGDGVGYYLSELGRGIKSYEEKHQHQDVGVRQNAARLVEFLRREIDGVRMRFGRQ